MKLKNILTFLMIVGGIIAVIELSRFSFYLMNQPDTFVFYIGLFILSIVVLGVALIAYRAIGRLTKGTGITKDDPTENKTTTSSEDDKEKSNQNQ